MPNTKTKDAIERALTAAVEHGQLSSWARERGYGPHPKWSVVLNPGARAADGGTRMEIRTYAEAHLLCAALASAHLARDRRTVDVSDVDGVLAGFEIHDDDGVEQELVCASCPAEPGVADSYTGRRICGIDDGDSMDTLVRLCLDHQHDDPHPEGTGT